MDLTTAVRLSCLLEASALKAGNVHPEAHFGHLTYDDFVRSGQVVAPILSQASVRGVGPTILEAVRATRIVCEHNTNLGIVLLLAPLAAVPVNCRVTDGIGSVLSSLTRADSDAVYEAIRVAAPRGLGDAEAEDVSVGPTGSLVEVMTLAADRDLIAAQYATGFSLVIRFASRLESLNLFPDRWESAILQLQLELMANHPDTDISRKRGLAEAVESADRAQAVLDAGYPADVDSLQRFSEFDTWLRERGSQRNPGTTADLITASLFVAIRDRLIVPPTEDAVGQHVRDCRIPSP
jgi:triphosphoribosyl-dephospho-CoA synthase